MPKDKDPNTPDKESKEPKESKQPNASDKKTKPSSSHHDPLLFCLLNLARYHRRPASPSSVTAGLPLVEGKLTPELVLRAAEKIGLTGTISDEPLREINRLALPAIVTLKGGKACVLEYIDANDDAHIMQEETGKGSQTISLLKLEANSDGEVIFLSPAYQFDQRSALLEEKKDKNWFWGVVKKSWGTYSEVLVASFLINIFALAAPLFIMNVYDRVVPNQAIETLWVLAIGIGIVLIFDFLMRTLRAYFINNAGKRIDTELSAKIHNQMLGMRMDSRPQSVGGMTNAVNSFSNFRDFITSASVSILVDIPFILLFLAVIWIIGGSLVLVPLLLIPVVLLVGFLLRGRLNSMTQKNYRFAAQKEANLIESLNGIETLKASNAEGVMQANWEEITANSAALGSEMQNLSGIGANFSVLAQQLGTIGVVVGGVYQIADCTNTMGGLIASTILTGRAMAPMAQVSTLVTRGQMSWASLASLNNLMAMPTDQSFQEVATLQRPPLQGDIELKNVSFTYPNQKIQALQNVSFKIRHGERVGIIGRIGSGKTTLGKLIIDLYQPNSGSILLDDTASAQLNVADVRHDIGYLPQEPALFFGSIRDNIALSSPYIEDEKILEAAKIAGVDSFVNHHPEGYDRPVGEGGRSLSGGQRQAIALARVFLHDPNVLVLDEPTNAMDDRTEAQFKANLAKVIPGKTLVLITHRGTMLPLVDRLIVLEAGRVVADGPREEILTALAEGRIKPPKLS